MGQYFLCANIDKREWMHSADCFKMLEHSWIGNEFVESVEALLAGVWKNNRIVWAGQYMESGLFLPDGINRKITLYDFAKAEYMALKPTEKYPVYRFIVSSTAKQFIDKDKSRDNGGWRIHPLPVMTASGNGQGSGDYSPRNDHDGAFVGTWAGHRIYTANEAPKNYSEIIPDFFEELK